MSTPTARIARERLVYIIGWDRLNLADPRVRTLYSVGYDGTRHPMCRCVVVPFVWDSSPDPSARAGHWARDSRKQD